MNKISDPRLVVIIKGANKSYSPAIDIIRKDRES